MILQPSHESLADLSRPLISEQFRVDTVADEGQISILADKIVGPRKDTASKSYFEQLMEKLAKMKTELTKKVDQLNAQRNVKGKFMTLMSA